MPKEDQVLDEAEPPRLQKSGESRFLVFSLSGKDFAVPLMKVREVIARTEITEVPHTLAAFA